MRSDESNPLDQRIQGLLWTAAQLDAMMAGQSPSAAARAARFAREQFAALPVTHAAGRRQRCRICRRTLSTSKRKDAVCCSARCRDRAYRRRRRSAAVNAAELEWTLKLHAGEDPRCAQCGHPFSPEMYRLRRPDRRYCSATCRTRAWRARKTSAQTVTNTKAVTVSPDG